MSNSATRFTVGIRDSFGYRSLLLTTVCYAISFLLCWFQVCIPSLDQASMGTLPPYSPYEVSRE